MTSALVEKLSDVRDFRKILETTVKELGEQYEADISQIVLSNPLDPNITSICEYLSNPDEQPSADIPCSSFPLNLEGGGLGLVHISRSQELSEQEANEIRITLAQIGNILRYAQINDIVQRDTFRNAFMSEITNLMTLPMGLGDALFMVVNILGKALNCNRCLFICTDDLTTGWKCFEYWQRERVESSQDYGWPTKDSAIVSQTLLASAPIVDFEGQQLSYLTPIQEEMQFIGVRSLLSVPIRSSVACHGAIIVQACESRHAWTRDEVDMVQNAADTVAEALAQLPDEKKDLEPIMRLHQRDVAETKDPNQQNIQDIRKALKGSFGQTAIPSARKGAKKEDSAPAASVKQAAPELAEQTDYDYGESSEYDYTQPPAEEFPAAGESVQYDYQYAEESTAEYQQEGYGEQTEYTESTEEGTFEFAAEEQQTEYQPEDFSFETAEAAAEDAADTAAMGGLANAITGEAATPQPQGFKGLLGGILGNSRAGNNSAGAWDIETSQPTPPEFMPDEEAVNDLQPAAESSQSWGDLDAIPTPTGGGLGKAVPPAKAQPRQPASPPQTQSGSKWGNLDAINAPSPTAKPDTGGGAKWGDLDSIPTPGGAGAPAAKPAAKPQAKPAAAQAKPAPAKANKWGDLDSIPTPGPGGGPAAAPAKGGSDSWGNLDAIPTPGGAGSGASPAPRGGGLGGAMMGKARASAVLGGAGLSAAFSKGAGKAAQFVEGPPVEVDEEAAQQKFNEILSESNVLSDYIFNTPGMSPRVLGRIDGWVSQVEAKDKYVYGSARQVAEYSVAIARLLGLEEEEIELIRLAAICHDVGKLGLAQAVLQKPDENLSDAELVQTMNHPIDGAKLLEGFSELAPLAPIVIAHHEEYDSNGYPAGLSGEDIPLGARIIFVANAYHTMVSDLVYRSGMSPENALEMLSAGSGSSFDPNIVEAFFAAINQGLVPAVIQ